MKPFKIGTKVDILHSGNDNAPEWTAGEVSGIIRRVLPDGGPSGNTVRIGKGKFVEVTEPMMIREVR